MHPELHLPFYVPPIGSIVAASLLWLFAPGLFAGEPDPWHFAGFAVLACLVLEAWRRRHTRRRRDQREGLRNSALW